VQFDEFELWMWCVRPHENNLVLVITILF